MSSLLFLSKTIDFLIVNDYCKLSFIERGFFMNSIDEARYHFILSDMADLVDEYGYANVINDLEDMIQAKVNAMLYEVTNV